MATPKSPYAQGRNPNSLANLRPHAPGHVVPHEAASRGGKASVQAKKRKRLMRDALRDILDAELCGAAPDEAEIIALLSAMGVENPTNADAVALATARKALMGDVEAARFVRDTAGEKPAEAVEIGNLNERPFESLDLSKLTDEQLKELLIARSDDGDVALDVAPSVQSNPESLENTEV